MDFGGPFGTLCPTPDFRAAATFTYTQAWRNVKRDAGRNRKPVALIGLLIAVGVIGVGVWRFRKGSAQRTSADGK